MMPDKLKLSLRAERSNLTVHIQIASSLSLDNLFQTLSTTYIHVGVLAMTSFRLG